MKTKLPFPTSSTRGFTLLEIMVVLLIIGLLLAVVAGGLSGFEETGNKVATTAKVSSIQANLTAYKTLGGMYPTNNQGLRALIQKPSDPAPRSWTPQVKSEADLRDAWGHELKYRYPGVNNPTKYDVWSIGGDGQDGTDDDIGNW